MGWIKSYQIFQNMPEIHCKYCNKSLCSFKLYHLAKQDFKYCYNCGKKLDDNGLEIVYKKE